MLSSDVCRRVRPVSDGDHLNLKACSLGEEYVFFIAYQSN